MGRITPNQINDIADELRITRYKGTTERAFGYIYNKYKDLFISEKQFLYLMKICATFFTCKYENEEDMIADRANTVYVYVDPPVTEIY